MVQMAANQSMTQKTESKFPLGSSYKGFTLRRNVEWYDHAISVWVEHESGIKSRTVTLCVMSENGNQEVAIGKAFITLMVELRDEMRVYKEMGV